MEVALLQMPCVTLSLDQSLELLDGRRHVVGMSEAPHRRSRQLGFAVPEQLTEGAIHVQGHSVDPHERHPDWRMCERLREALATLPQGLVGAPSRAADFRRAQDLLDDGHDLRRRIDREDAGGSRRGHRRGAVVQAVDRDDERNVEVRQELVDRLATGRQWPPRAHEVPRLPPDALRDVATGDASPDRLVPTTTERLQQEGRVGSRSVNYQQAQRYGHAGSVLLARDRAERGSEFTRALLLAARP